MQKGACYPLRAKSQAASAMKAMTIKRVVASAKVWSRLTENFCMDPASLRFYRSVADARSRIEISLDQK